MGFIAWYPRCPDHELACPDKKAVRVGQEENPEVIRPCTCASQSYCIKHGR
jgi:hypothetical protein